ncbi:MAG: ABC transporter ATP-binding protein [Anaerolineales bacterium]|nr:ABC transporter ATP-binding protein [Anaerolineales bacterium]
MDKYTVRFDRVSKRYDLGLTRTSVPGLVSKAIKNVLKPSTIKSADDNVLWALRDLSFELKQGESLAMIGSNGAGKTTSLKLLANITKPTSGAIETHGNLSALIELGAGFHPDLTGRENVYLNGIILGLKRKEVARRFDEIVSFSELERFIDTPVKRYSSGMKVRLGFAVAACINTPDILLVDEVLAVGDATFRQKCIKRIQDLIEQGTSIIFVSHNLWLVQAVCSSAIYMERGQVKQRGDTAEVIAAYDRDLNMRRAVNFKQQGGQQAHGDSELEIVRIEISDQDGHAISELRNDQTLVVRCKYAAYNDLGDVNVVVRIIRSDGLTCCMMRTSLDQFRVNIERGAGEVSVALDPVQLYGGAYYAQALFRDATDAETIAMGSTDWFYVTGSALSHQEMNGVFEPKRKWSWNSTPGEISVDPTVRHPSAEQNHHMTESANNGTI